MDLQKIFIADPVNKACEELLVKQGFSVTTKYKLSTEDLIKELKDFDALIVRSETTVTAAVLQAAKKLKVVARAGTGVDNIDVKTATAQGILVINAPGGNSISACELTCGLILDLARNISPASHSMKRGEWERKQYAGNEVQGKTLGIIGLGRVGFEVASRMKAFGMEIVAYDPFVTPEQAAKNGMESVPLVDIWKRSDYITIHTPLIPETANLINKNTLALCKKGVYIINVARGGIVDEKALLDSINAGHCGGAAVDVFAQEPPKDPVTLEMIKNPKVVATPHLGASTAEAQVRVAVEIAQQLTALAGKSTEYKVSGAVNKPVQKA